MYIGITSGRSNCVTIVTLVAIVTVRSFLVLSVQRRIRIYCVMKEEEQACTAITCVLCFLYTYRVFYLLLDRVLSFYRELCNNVASDFCC